MLLRRRMTRKIPKTKIQKPRRKRPQRRRKPRRAARNRKRKRTRSEVRQRFLPTLDFCRRLIALSRLCRCYTDVVRSYFLFSPEAPIDTESLFWRPFTRHRLTQVDSAAAWAVKTRVYVDAFVLVATYDNDPVPNTVLLILFPGLAHHRPAGQACCCWAAQVVHSIGPRQCAVETPQQGCCAAAFLLFAKEPS